MKPVVRVLVVTDDWPGAAVNGGILRWTEQATAQATASRIPGAKFVGFNKGGHLLVGHDEAVRAEIARLPIATAGP